jgi:hypothetical protein
MARMATRAAESPLAEDALLGALTEEEPREEVPGDAGPLIAPALHRRALTTTVPEVSCEVCERRLLRGERPQSFLAGSSARLVCELCTDRALEAGWVRASELASAPREGEVYSRRRRRRTLLERIRGGRVEEQRRSRPSTGGSA